MSKAEYTDNQVIEMIKQGGHRRNEALRFIYTRFRNSAKAIMVAAGANAPDADDAIQEAIVVLDNSIRNGKYQQNSSLKNYFIGICKGRLYSNKRSTKRINWTDDNLKMDGIETQQPETLMLEEEEKSILHDILNLLDEKCRDVLRLYKLSYSMSEIAEETDLGNANNVRQWVFKCRKRLVKLASQNPSFINYFK